MPPELLRTFGFVLAVIVSAPLSIACLRAASFFGSMKTTIEAMGKNIESMTTTVGEHASRLSVVETEVRNLIGDRPVHTHARASDR